MQRAGERRVEEGRKEVLTHPSHLRQSSHLWSHWGHISWHTLWPERNDLVTDNEIATVITPPHVKRDTFAFKTFWKKSWVLSKFLVLFIHLGVSLQLFYTSNFTENTQMQDLNPNCHLIPFITKVDHISECVGPTGTGVPLSDGGIMSAVRACGGSMPLLTFCWMRCMARANCSLVSLPICLVSARALQGKPVSQHYRHIRLTQLFWADWPHCWADHDKHKSKEKKHKQLNQAGSLSDRISSLKTCYIPKDKVSTDAYFYWVSSIKAIKGMGTSLS